MHFSLEHPTYWTSFGLVLGCGLFWHPLGSTSSIRNDERGPQNSPSVEQTLGNVLCDLALKQDTSEKARDMFSLETNLE
jgi:hypothetical protein